MVDGFPIWASLLSGFSVWGFVGLGARLLWLLEYLFCNRVSDCLELCKVVVYFGD